MIFIRQTLTQYRENKNSITGTERQWKLLLHLSQKNHILNWYWNAYRNNRKRKLVTIKINQLSVCFLLLFSNKTEYCSKLSAQNSSYSVVWRAAISYNHCLNDAIHMTTNCQSYTHRRQFCIITLSRLDNLYNKFPRSFSHCIYLLKSMPLECGFLIDVKSSGVKFESHFYSCLNALTNW